MPAVFEFQSSNRGDDQLLAQSHPFATEALRLQLSTLQEACTQERPEATIRELEATSSVFWSNRRAMIFIGHALTAHDVLQANDPSGTIAQSNERVDEDLVGKLAMGHQLSITRTTSKGPGAYGNACLALDLVRPPQDQPGEHSKLRLLIPAEALGALTIGSRLYYRPRHELFDTEAYMQRYAR